MFSGRSKELGQIRSILDRAEPQVVRVTGIRGGGKSALVRRAVTEQRCIAFTCPALPDPIQRAALWDRLQSEASRDGIQATSGGHTHGDGPPDWSRIFALADDIAASGDRALVLVLDDAHRLSEARARYLGALGSRLVRPLRQRTPLHLVLVGPEAGLPGVEELSPAPVETVTVEPLPLRAAAPLLPGSRPLDKLEAYAVLGGLPRVLNRIDRGVTTGTNLRRLILHPSGSLSEAGADFLERDLQTPPRYNAIMLALSRGETDWGGVHAGVPDLSRSGQVAPYIARLAQLGLVVGRRSLDASAASRSTRYAIADPFLAFWFRFVLPYRHGLRESESDYHARVIRPGMADHLQRMFPEVCRQHMRFDAIETMGANARENGSLWGTDYDLPIAGLLTSGAAYYGTCAWSYDERSAAPIAEIEHGMRESRYGFGRERRVRLVFTGLPAPRSLRREVARNREALLIDADALLGA